MIADALNSTGTYSEHDLALFLQEVVCYHVHAGDYIITPGKIADSVYFILSGAVCQYIIDDNNEEVVLDLWADGQWVMDRKSFMSREPSLRFTKTYENCHLMELSVHAIHKLIGLSPAFFQLGRLLDSSGLRSDFFDLSASPMEKYQLLMNSAPLLFQKFPLKTIASFLKVTPETMSRVRRKLVSGDARS